MLLNGISTPRGTSGGGTWGSITGDQSVVNVSGFTNDAGYITSLSGAVLTDQTTAQHVTGGALIFDSGLATQGDLNYQVSSVNKIETGYDGSEYFVYNNTADSVFILNDDGSLQYGTGATGYSSFFVYAGGGGKFGYGVQIGQDITDATSITAINILSRTLNNTSGTAVAYFDGVGYAGFFAPTLSAGLIYNYTGGNTLAIDTDNRYLVSYDGTWALDWSGASTGYGGVKLNGNLDLDSHSISSVDNIYATAISVSTINSVGYLNFADGSSINGSGGNIFVNSAYGTVIYNSAYVSGDLYMYDGGGNHKIADTTGNLYYVNGTLLADTYGVYYENSNLLLADFQTGLYVRAHIIDSANGYGTFGQVLVNQGGQFAGVNWSSEVTLSKINLGTGGAYIQDNADIMIQATGSYGVIVNSSYSTFNGSIILSSSTTIDYAIDGNGRNGLKIYDFVNGTSAYIHADVTYAGLGSPNGAILWTPDGQNYYGSSVTTLDSSGNFVTSGSVTGITYLQTQNNYLGAAAILNNDDGSGNPYLTLGYQTITGKTDGVYADTLKLITYLEVDGGNFNVTTGGNVTINGEIQMSTNMTNGVGTPATILTDYKLYVDTLTGIVYIN